MVVLLNLSGKYVHFAIMPNWQKPQYVSVFGLILLNETKENKYMKYISFDLSLCIVLPSIHSLTPIKIYT